MSKLDNNELLDKRLHALAIIQLTRRPDLTVHDQEFDFGCDLVVSVHHDREPRRAGLRLFAVQIKGGWKKVPAPKANLALRATIRELQQAGPWPFPFVVFYYSMEGDQGWYTWATEPVISSRGECSLQVQEKPACQPLDDRALDQIVERVDGWYDAFFARSALAIF